MADVNRGKRPLSPHLDIYRLPLTAVLSILHRITGAGMLLGAVLVVWWFAAAAVSPEYFALVDGLMTSWIGLLVMTGLLWALWYHCLTGIRHLVWDTGRHFDITRHRSSSYAIIGGSVVLTLLTIIVI